MTTPISDRTNLRQTIIDGLHALYGVAPEGFPDPITGIIGMVPDNELHKLTLELAKAITKDATERETANRSRRR